MISEGEYWKIQIRLVDAELEGFEAYSLGVKLEENPYVETDPLGQSWAEGWLSSKGSLDQS